MDYTANFFDRHAARWDCRRSPSEDGKIELILSRLKFLPGESVLNIGCGTGVLLPFLEKRGIAAYTGLDYSEAMTREFRRKFPAHRIVNENWQNPGLFPDGSFSKIIIYNAFPHFSDPAAALKNSFAALRRGGTLCIAHSRTREKLALHHRNAGGAVSGHSLPLDAEFCALYSNAGFESVIMDNKRYFYSSGQKP